jgi:ssDNA-binding replication factor A large subunit
MAIRRMELRSCSSSDVIAVVRSVSDMQTVVGKTSQKEFHNRELVLVDETAAITTTLWGQQVSVTGWIFAAIGCIC